MDRSRYWLETLPEPFKSELVGPWNDWLLKEYGTDAKVQAAWIAEMTPQGPGLLREYSDWSFEQHETSQMELTRPNLLGPQLPLLGGLLKRYEHADSPDIGPGPDVDVHITHFDGTVWHIQVHQSGLDLQSTALTPSLFA